MLADKTLEHLLMEQRLTLHGWTRQHYFLFIVLAGGPTVESSLVLMKRGVACRSNSIGREITVDRCMPGTPLD